MRGRLLLIAALTACGLAASRGSASAQCTVSAVGVSFGPYNVLDASPTYSDGRVTYYCNNPDHRILISLSRGSGPSCANRRLLNPSGSEFLDYNLYLVPYSQVWCDGSGSSSQYFIKNPPNRTNVVVTIYGRIPAGQDVGPGDYSDTIQVTIDF